LQRSSTRLHLGQFTRRAQKVRIERLCRHDLAAADQPYLVGPVIGDGPMDRAEMVSQQDVVFGPDMGVAELGLQLIANRNSSICSLSRAGSSLIRNA
jgi:hypothetical protein